MNRIRTFDKLDSLGRRSDLFREMRACVGIFGLSTEVFAMFDVHRSLVTCSQIGFCELSSKNRSTASLVVFSVILIENCTNLMNLGLVILLKK